MRIAHLHLHPIRPGEAPATHVHGIVDGLRRLGHGVEVFAPAVGHPGRGRLRASRDAQRRAAASRADVVYVRQHLLGSAVMGWARQAGLPVVLEVNGGPLDYTMARPWLLPATPFFDRVLGRQLAAADGVVAVTEGLADWARGHGARRVAVIGNAADRDLVDATIEPTPPPAVEGRPYLLYFGALARWQGVQTLLDAAALPQWPDDVALVVLGEGALRPAVQQAAAARPHRIVHLPPVARDAVPGIVRAALATASVPHDVPRARSGLSPIKVFESLAVGTPVIGGDLPGLADLIAETGGGVTVPPDDPATLASTVAALHGDAQRRDQLAAAGRAAVAARHTWDHRAAATADFLAEVIATT